MNFNLRSQATVYKTVEFKGIGVHSGSNVSMKIKKAPENSGIVFKRTDIKDKNSIITLSPDSVVDPTLCTRVVNEDGVYVSVVEHLLAAFRILGITNAIVELNHEEIPIMDGSASVFVSEIKKMGLINQKAYVPALFIKEDISVENKNGKISIKPSDSSMVSIKLSYGRINPVIQSNNVYNFNIIDDDLSDISKARTFGWVEDYEKIKSMGLARGSSLENTIVISSDNSILNKEGLRNPDEIIMHKCLDLLGDIFVIGYDIIGKIEGLNISHSLNNMLMRKLFNEINKHEIIRCAQPDDEAFDDFSDLKVAVF